MKTNRLFRVVVGCLVCAAGVQVTSCTSTPGEDKQLPDKRDTTTFVDTVALPFGVERITIDAAGGDIEVVFKPVGDWTFSSATDWLKVTSASGKVADNVLKFKAAEFDQIGGSREAVTTITVGGVSKTVKFTQTGMPRFVHIYDMRLVLDDKKTTAKVKNIISNVTELEVASVPMWVKSAEIVKDPKVDTQWVVNLELVRPSYDDEDRTGNLVIRDKNFQDYTFEIPLDLLASTSKYIATPGYKSSDLVARGTEAQMTHTFSISSAPGAEDYSVFFHGMDAAYSMVKTPATWITAKPSLVQPAAAYGNRTYEFKMDINENVQNWTSSRNANVLVVPKSELDPITGMPLEVKNSYSVMTINQQSTPVLKGINCTGKTGMNGQFVYDAIEVLCAKVVLEADNDGPGPQKEKTTIGMSEETVVTIMVKMAKGFKPNIVIPTIAKIPESVEPEFKWVGSIDLGTPVSEGDLDVYTVKINCSAHDYKTVATASVVFGILIYTGDQAWDLASQEQLDRGYMVPLSYVNAYTVDIPTEETK